MQKCLADNQFGIKTLQSYNQNRFIMSPNVKELKCTNKVSVKEVNVSHQDNMSV